jgi:hypothetical protein
LLLIWGVHPLPFKSLSALNIVSNEMESSRGWIEMGKDGGRDSAGKGGKNLVQRAFIRGNSRISNRMVCSYEFKIN